TRLIEALHHIAKACIPTKAIYIIEETGWKQIAIPFQISPPTAIGLPPVRGDELFTESIKLTEAANRVAAEMVIPYPPGIPVLYTGESISAAMVTYLIELAQLGARFQGCRDTSMQSLLVRKVNPDG